MAEKQFTVEDLAKLMKVGVATARMKLRKGKVKKAGKSYAWKSKTELQSVATKLAA